MRDKSVRLFSRVMRSVAVAAALYGTLVSATAGEAQNFEAAFDNALGTAPRAPRIYSSALEAQIAALASPEQGRIGVAAVDLASGKTVAVLGDQPFPMASTSKIAIVATF